MNKKTFSIDHLTEEQKYVTQESGTERPYQNQFWDFFDAGIYVDIVSAEVLFASIHKFSSQCGWPSFYKSCAPDNLIYVEDQSHGMKRVEVRSKAANSHLGHIFTDGPAPTGLRFCINSAALRFIPKAELKEVYKEYLYLFEECKK